MKKYLILSLFAALLIFSDNLYAQHVDTLEIRRDKSGKIAFAKFNVVSTTNSKHEDNLGFLRRALKAKTKDEFRLIKSEIDNFGINHQTFQQYYGDIKVDRINYKLHLIDGYIEVMNGEYADINIPSTTPVLTEEEALRSALNYVKARKYTWEDINLEQYVKKASKDSKATYYPKGEIVISKDYLQSGASWVLAWKFKISALEPQSEQFIYVDATNGEIINSESLIHEINTQGTAETRYSGSRNLTADSFSGGFKLREVRNGVNIATLNAQRGSSIGNAIDFIDNDNNWTALEHNNVYKDQAALDVHWAAEVTLDYWKIVHNRNSIDNNGLQVSSYVHFQQNWYNASWDGSNNVMRFGDGGSNPLTSLDIFAHEFGHGVTQYSTGLVYQGESGAINEGLSDIWGAVIEFWAVPGKQRWLIGEDVGSTLRSMSNPNNYGDPDTYHGTYWYSGTDDNGGVHTNSGVLNYWFYLLTEGGNGTNDIGKDFDVSGINIQDASHIVYQALNYLTASSNYQDARSATIQAAIDIFGVNSCPVMSVTNAWHAVGVGAKYQTTFTISGPDDYCTSASYQINNLPLGSTVTWSVSGPHTITSSITANPVSVAKVGNGKATLSATITNVCGSIKKDIIVGTPVIDEIIITNEFGEAFNWCSSHMNNGIKLVTNVASFDSEIEILSMPSMNVLSAYTGGSDSMGVDNPLFLPSLPPAPGWYMVRARNTNGCEAGEWLGMIVEVVDCSYAIAYDETFSITASPNPTSDKLSVEISEKIPNNVKSIQGEDILIALYDSNTGIVVKQWTFKNSQSRYDLNLRGLSKGLYLLHVSKGINKQSKRIIIE